MPTIDLLPVLVSGVSDVWDPDLSASRSCPHLPGEDQPSLSLQIAFSSNGVRSVFTLDLYMASSRVVSPLSY